MYGSKYYTSSAILPASTKEKEADWPKEDMKLNTLPCQYQACFELASGSNRHMCRNVAYRVNIWPNSLSLYACVLGRRIWKDGSFSAACVLQNCSVISINHHHDHHQSVNVLRNNKSVFGRRHFSNSALVVSCCACVLSRSGSCVLAGWLEY